MGWTFEEMDRMFHPRVVAVVGDKRDRDYMWLRSVSTIRGRVYSVQVDPQEIEGIRALGFPNYPSLRDIPEAVDYVIVAVPRHVAPRVLQDAIHKGVHAVMFFTAGFAETGEEEGIRLQQVLTEMARAARMKVVGPNCMGLFNPRWGLRHHVDQYYGEGGPVGFISQSGTHANAFSLVGYQHGITISKSVSMGNGIILHADDYLDYLGQDPQTQVIAMYLEGVPHARRLFHLMQAISPRKPIVVWKGGQTSEGARAAQSHTASLAASTALWQGAVRQANALWADSFEETLDLVKALCYLKEPVGPRLGLVAMTGGQSVVITDAFAKAGLQVPLLSSASYQELATFYSTVGGSYRNPMDMTPTIRNLDLVQRVLDILARDAHIDAICYEVNLAFVPRGERGLDRLVDLLGAFRERYERPFLCVLTPMHREGEEREVRLALARRGVPAFPSFLRAATAYRKVWDYYRERRERLVTPQAPALAQPVPPGS
ncbi:MAG: CoA-binding protein [Dehalococcoidia bacterium]|nr:CoA-binding protein [Dehalococcoidia bacterium]MDW8120256.1 CoA-binding protein [Chloroflexota bacterium]